MVSETYNISLPFVRIPAPHSGGIFGCSGPQYEWSWSQSRTRSSRPCTGPRVANRHYLETKGGKGKTSLRVQRGCCRCVYKRKRSEQARWRRWWSYVTVRCHNVHKHDMITKFVTHRMIHVHVRGRLTGRSFDACKEYPFRCYDESKCALRVL